MAQTAEKTAKKSGKRAPKKPGKKTAEIQLSDTKAFMCALAAFFLIAIFAYISPLKAVFLSEYGVFSNAAVLFYVVAFGYGLRGIYELNLENRRLWKNLAILSLLALFMAGEELHWGLSFILEQDKRWPVESVHDLIARAILGVPREASFALIGFIAGVRLSMLLFAVYLVIGLMFFRDRIMGFFGKACAHPAWFYGCIFTGLLVISILMKAGIVPGGSVFDGALRLSMALAFLIGSLQFGGKTP